MSTNSDAIATSPSTSSTRPNDALSLTNNDPIISPAPPIHTRLIHGTAIWAFKQVMTTSIFLSHRFFPLPASQPSPIIKTYPIQQSLKSRIFIPPHTGSPENQQNVKYPIYFSMHGGGWAAGSPDADDDFCSSFCLKNNIIVASLDYRKSPKFKFPLALTDVSALVSCVLADESLPIDVSKVAIGGFSAGGNLAFAACQTEELRGKIAAVIGFYPVLDLTETRELKESRRPKGKDVPTDGLGWAVEFVDWGYVPQGQDRRDPLLSPRFAARRALPNHVYLVGAEWDMLCFEAEATAENLVIDGEERRHVEGHGWDGWIQGKVRWECFRRRMHAFMEVREWTRKKEDERASVVGELYGRVGAWLREVVWADSIATET